MKYTWGDTVEIESNAPDKYKKFNLGEIVGYFIIEDEQNSNQFNLPIGTILYTIEFGDGTDIDIPEQYLKKYER
jgi:hypothetical protein